MADEAAQLAFMAAEDANLERIIERYLLRESLLKDPSLPHDKKKKKKTKKNKNKKFQPKLKASSVLHDKKKKKKTKNDKNKNNN
ncbi:hypothetical protein P8452_20238 [Trifolium repens]|nr:hypothetical protein P8452_20238 [Trifolium repens]